MGIIAQRFSARQEALTLAIRLAGSCHAASLKARPKVRTRFNQAVLEAVYVKDRQLQRVEITEVFEALFSRPNSNKRAMAGLSGCYSNLVDELRALT